MEIIFALVIGVNGIFYWNKYTLKQNGYPVSWFFNHFRDIPNMFDLAKKTEDPGLKKMYLFRAWSLPLSIPLVMFVLFAR
ncbi:MAG: hypothetical protein ACI865_001416 [Flavobacteriaceae bacterium]|jgi:hypothetical protein